MQSQYSAYTTQITTILIVLTVALALFAIAVPLLNYGFFQKEQVEKINKQLENAKMQYDENCKQYEEYKKKFEELEKRFNDELVRQKNTIQLSLDVAQKVAQETLVDKNSNIVFTPIELTPISDTPKDKVQVYEIEAKFFMYQSKFDNVINTCVKIIKLQPDNAEAYANRGVANVKKEKYDEAIVDLNKSIELDPDEPSCYSIRAYAFCEKEEYHKAISDYTKAIELDKDFAVAYSSRAKAYHALAEQERANGNTEAAKKYEDLATADEEKAKELENAKP